MAIDPVSQHERILEGYKHCLQQYTIEELAMEMEYQFRHGKELIPMMSMIDRVEMQEFWMGNWSGQPTPILSTVDTVDIGKKLIEDIKLVIDYLQAIREEIERRSI